MCIAEDFIKVCIFMAHWLTHVHEVHLGTSVQIMLPIAGIRF